MHDQSSEFRVCPKCGERKPSEAFARGHKAGQCKKCVATYERERHARHRAPKQPKPRPTEKRCLTCSKVKPIAEFQKSQVHKGVQYHTARCRGCISEQRRANYVHIPRKKPDLTATERRCGHCKETKSLDEFSPQPGNALGRSYWCRACFAARQLEWVRQHPEEAKAMKARGYLAHRTEVRAKHCAYNAANRDRLSIANAIRHAANPEPARRRAKAWRLANIDRFDAARQLRRARMKGVPSPTFTGAEWAALQLLFDYRCAYCWQRAARLSQDHMQPLSRGGAHSASNIVPACLPCNNRKQAKNLLEFLLYRSRIAELTNRRARSPR